jgi:hypothetical protein
MDIGAVTWVFERVDWLIERLAAREDKRLVQRQQAVDALLRALNETRIYFGTQRLTKERNRSKEEEISRLWVEASKHVQPFDEEFANRCYAKGSYWADPVGWQEQDFMQADISIEQVENSLKDLRTDLR